jgi:glycerol-3-phosphate acyltransferase PlsX
VREELALAGWDGARIAVVPAEQVIAMSDSPVEALSKKKGSSIEVATRMVRTGTAAAVVSAGNTGACVAASSLLLGRLDAVKRPGIAVVFDTGKTPVVVIDVGANVHSKPEHLIQYGLMATIYAEEILGVTRPKVGLLNVGEEDEKGSNLAKTTHHLFQKTKLNFVGNVEGADIFGGDVEVVVCDGFVGNIVLKVSEGLAENLMAHAVAAIKQGLATLPDNKEIGPALKRAFASLEKRIDYSEYGGAPLLGVNGTVIIGHGRSDAKAISNAVRVAQRMAACDLNRRFTEALSSNSH